MDRRTFLRRAGLGSIAVASAPGVVGALATPARADDGFRFRFVALATAGDIEGVQHRLIIHGNGRFDDSSIRGFGTWAHINLADPDPATNVLASGKWRPTNLVRFDLEGIYAEVLAAGVLETEVFLKRVFPEPGTFEGTLTVVCDIPPGGLDAPGNAGIVLSIDGAPVGPFTQLAGLTIFVPPLDD
ncbi:MAG TPA: hypothetical protein VNO17_06940 [Actinomycetota bacterium]|nr:hypothetical protein [Actinomycetota bacterium]